MGRGTRDALDAEASSPASLAACRLDVVLHQLCLVPTRTQAARAIDDAAVLVNGERVRPAHLVRIGDTLALTYGHRTRTRTYAITALPARGQSRKDAPQFYRLLTDEDTAR